MTDESTLQPPTTETNPAAPAIELVQPPELQPQPEAASVQAADTTTQHNFVAEGVTAPAIPAEGLKYRPPSFTAVHVGQNQFQIHEGGSPIGPVLSPTDSATVLNWLKAATAGGE